MLYNKYKNSYYNNYGGKQKIKELCKQFEENKLKLYYISNLGNVKSIDKRNNSEYLIKPKDNGHGYGHIQVEKNGKAKSYKTHRLVVEAFKSPMPDRMTVDHIDKNPMNNCIYNLKVVTRAENTRRARNKVIKVTWVDDAIEYFENNMTLANYIGYASVNNISHWVSGKLKSYKKYGIKSISYN